jgi:D-threo-aldose 1-dehydrogenase
MPEAPGLPNLPQRRLGRTGLKVTVVGLGCAWLGQQGGADTGQGRLDEEQALATIWSALTAGVRLLDTAPLYLNTQSECLVARALSERPALAADVIIQTKMGHRPEPFDYSYTMTMRCVEGSLERLGRAHLPLLYIHDAPAELFERVMAADGALGALRQLQRQGVVGHIGIANNNPLDNALYSESGEFAMAVVPEAYSLLNQVATERILPAAERFGMGIVLAVPLEKGLLATGIRSGQTYPGRRFSAECLAHVGRLEDLCAEYDISLLAAALQFCLRHPAVTAVIPGGRTPTEARQNALAVRESIPEAFWSALQPLIRTWELGVHR